MKFEWDPAKERANRSKHGISFADAEELFGEGVDCLEVYDEEHSIVEDRFIAIGPTRVGVLVVVFTEPADDTIRIVSARSATRAERERLDSYRHDKHE